MGGQQVAAPARLVAMGMPSAPFLNGAAPWQPGARHRSFLHPIKERSTGAWVTATRAITWMCVRPVGAGTGE